MAAERGAAASDPAGRKRPAVLDVDDSVRVADPEQLLERAGFLAPAADTALSGTGMRARGR